MDANEKLVRDTWEDPMNGMGNFNRNLYPAFMDDWAAAAEFTRQHKQKIMDVDKEIALLCGWRHVQEGNPAALQTLEARRAYRADLTRGMKGMA